MPSLSPSSTKPMPGETWPNSPQVASSRSDNATDEPWAHLELNRKRSYRLSFRKHHSSLPSQPLAANTGVLLRAGFGSGTSLENCCAFQLIWPQQQRQVTNASNCHSRVKDCTTWTRPRLSSLSRFEGLCSFVNAVCQRHTWRPEACLLLRACKALKHLPKRNEKAT